MLALSGESADGAIPIMVPPGYTAYARHALGPDKLLIIGLSVVADPDPAEAKNAARQRVAGLLSQPGTYTAALARAGYSNQDITDVTDGAGRRDHRARDAAAIEAKLGEHLAAGADHVVVMTNTTDLGELD
jgi:hypothetical protein